MLKIGIKSGMIFVALNKVSGKNEEIAYLGFTPTGEYTKIMNISNQTEEWLSKDKVSEKYELLEYLGF